MSLINNKTTLQRLGALSTPQGFTAISLLFYFLMQHKATASSAPLGEALMPAAFDATLVDPSAELVFEADTALIDFGELSFKAADPHQDAMTLVTQSLNTPSSSAELAAALPEDDSPDTETTPAAEHGVEIKATHASTGGASVASVEMEETEGQTIAADSSANQPTNEDDSVDALVWLIAGVGVIGVAAASGSGQSDEDTPTTEPSIRLVGFYKETSEFEFDGVFLDVGGQSWADVDLVMLWSPDSDLAWVTGQVLLEGRDFQAISAAQADVESGWVMAIDSLSLDGTLVALTDFSATAQTMNTVLEFEGEQSTLELLGLEAWDSAVPDLHMFIHDIILASGTVPVFEVITVSSPSEYRGVDLINNGVLEFDNWYYDAERGVAGDSWGYIVDTIG